MKKKIDSLNAESKRAAIYIRVFTDNKNKEGYSIEEQKDLLESYCKTLKVKSPELYIDDGCAGNDLNRPELQRLISNVKEKNVDIVMVYKLDRLSSNQKDMLFLIENIFNPNGVDFISLKEQLDTSSAIGKSMIGILSSFAQSERKNIYEKTKIGMKERVEQGYWMGGGRVPFGYDYSKEKNILIPNQDADTVRRIYDLYLQGYSADKIAQIVGLKYDRLVVQILTRKTNCGYITYNDVEYKGKHEAIVSEETYNKAMGFMQKRSVQKVVESNYLLAGLLVCGKCNAKMRYQKWGKNDAKIVCYSQYTSKPYLIKDPNCDNIKLWASEIEAAVIQDLFNFLLQFKNTAFDNSETSKVYDILQKQYESRHTQPENENTDAANRVSADHKRLLTIRENWKNMTTKEKRYVVGHFIEKIVITNDKIDIFYKFKTLDDEKLKENR